MTAARLFSPHEATQTLPLVKRIVDDILQRGQELRRLHESAPDSRNALTTLEELLQENLLELEALGCSFRDWNFELGLVDFPSRIDGEIVLLCWRSDEPELRFYHGLHDGYAGRKPIPESLLRAPGADESSGATLAISDQPG